DKVIRTGLIHQAVLQVIDQPEQKVCRVIFLSQVIRTDGFGSREKLNNQSFTSLVRLHETRRDALLQLDLAARKRQAPFVFLLACRRARRQQIKPANHFLLRDFPVPKMRGVPRVEKVERNATVISIILGVGGSRMLYDVVPVVSFKGWPAVAQSWLMENHFWDGKITEEEVISGFYLLPACSSTGQKENEWRLSFARSEVQLKKCISASLMQAYQACKALIIKLLSRPKAISPYHLRSLMLWACDRLPHTYLAQEDYAAHFLLGLIDDLQHCLVNKTCPNYFIPQCNMLEHLSDDAAMLHARKLSSVRSDPPQTPEENNPQSHRSSSS
uniref:Mab-21 domain containing 2 n=1 Tax=Cyprinus carpio TaxID=7962 RepID=A0A8C1IPD5_CYPCA